LASAPARSSRGGSSEETATRTNLEAAEEIARQLRLRDIGGLIVIDFIDMESSRHIRQVERAFAQSMTRDKARYDVTRISKLGLLEVSRQRMKTTKSASSFKPCPHCSGDGTVRTPESAARAAFRKIQARVARGGLAGVKVYLPGEVAVYLLNEKRDDLFRLESRQRMRIEVLPQDKMRVDQFEIEELRREEPEVVPMVTADLVDQAMAEGTLPTPVVGEAPPPMLSAADAAARAGERAVERARERGPDAGRMVEKRAGHPPEESLRSRRDGRDAERPGEARGGEARGGDPARRRRRRRGGRGGRSGERVERGEPSAQRASEHGDRGPNRSGEPRDHGRPHREHREPRPPATEPPAAHARPDFAEGPEGTHVRVADAGGASGQEFEGGASYSGNGAKQTGAAPQGGEPNRDGERPGRRRRRRRGRGRGRGGSRPEDGAVAASPPRSSDGGGQAAWSAESQRESPAAERWSAPAAQERYEERTAHPSHSREGSIERSAPSSDAAPSAAGGEGGSSEGKPKRRWWRRGSRT